MAKEKKIKAFNPNDPVNVNNNIYGLPFNIEESEVILIPVPWDVTVSSRDGTSMAPDAIFKASFQVDLYDDFLEDAWKYGISMDWVSSYWTEKNKKLRKKAEEHIEFLENKDSAKISLRKLKHIRSIRNEINNESKNLNKWLKELATSYLNKNKIVGAIGGDHSSSFGLIEAIADKYYDFGVLQIDAHNDLRKSYEGFAYSHASAMYNVSKIPQVSKIIQLGIRDYCEEELKYCTEQHNKITVFYDKQVKSQLFEGKPWSLIAQDIINTLPDNVYISFDIDGLDPKLCPNTGTPVPGGLQLEQVFYLFEKIYEAKKKIIGFDLCEVAPGNNGWDANVGARILYKLSNLAIKSKFF